MTLEPFGSTALYRADVSWKYIIGTQSISKARRFGGVGGQVTLHLAHHVTHSLHPPTRVGSLTSISQTAPVRRLHIHRLAPVRAGDAAHGAPRDQGAPQAEPRQFTYRHVRNCTSSVSARPKLHRFGVSKSLKRSGLGAGHATHGAPRDQDAPLRALNRVGSRIGTSSAASARPKPHRFGVYASLNSHRFVQVTPHMAHRVIKALRKLNVECIVAPYEARALNPKPEIN